MQNGEGKWIVFAVRDRYANDKERDVLKKDIAVRFGLKNDEIYYVPVGSNFVFCNFIFVREHSENDLRDILEAKRDFLEPYPRHMRITAEEFDSMVGGIESMKHRAYVKYGDIVMIKTGRYNKLYGIVLRECRSRKVEVGLKFCFGVIMEKYSPEELDVVGNIFNYLKVLN